MNRLRALLQRHRKIALDTSVFIYQLDANATYLPFTGPIFSWIEGGDSTAVASTVAMMEVLVGPCRDADEQRVADCYGLLSTYPNLDWLAPDLEIADLAANLRAVHRLQTPDALHAARPV